MSRFRSALLFVLATVLAGPAAAQLPTYGLAAAVGDDAVFVGQPLSFDGPGAVFVFERGADGAWAETHLLTAPDGVFGDGFGGALALDGARLLVGAASQSPFPNAPPPSAFVFERDADGRWQRTARLVLDPPVPTFGLRVALEGDVALVSAFAEDQMAGAAYVFRHANGTWTQEARLQPAAAEAGHRFGMAVALDGGRALIGAPGDGPSGAAYVFRHDGGAWTQEARLAHDDLGEDAGLGSAVYLHGDDALAGAPGAETVALFHAEGDGWMPHGALQPFVATPGFGSALAVTTDGILVGAPAGTSQPGAAYLFRHDADGSWTSAARLPATEPQTADLFGSATAARGDRAVVSAPGGDYSLGRVSVFERDAAGAWHEAAVLFSTTDPMASVTGEPRPCQGGEAAAFGCDRVDLISFLSVEDLGGRRGVIVNDLWGWTDPQTEGEYAVVGRNDGTVFIDLSDPANPIYLGFLPRTEGSPAATWRDVKVYRDHAFIVADGSGAHGMQVFDLTRLRDVQNPPVTFTPDVRYEGIASAHNIAINEETGIAYAVGSSSGGETCGGGLHMIDVREPQNPTFAGCFAHAGTGNNGQGSTHDAQCVTYHGPDADFQGREVCFGSNETALSIADVTDKDAPVVLAKATYPKIAYAHQGWLTEDHRYFYMNDEGDEMTGLVDGTRTLIWDLADLEDPVLVKEHVSENRAVDHNLYIRGNLMYQSNYVSGLRIYDVSDPENPQLVGFFDTVPGEDTPVFSGSWSNYPYFQSGLVVVTSMREGVFVLKRKDVDI